jgi:hypothetical protein
MADATRADVQRLLAEKLLARWVRAVEAGEVDDLPVEGQCDTIAAWVVEISTGKPKSATVIDGEWLGVSAVLELAAP